MDSSSFDSSFSCPSSETGCHFKQEILSLRQELDLLKYQVRTDALTGLYNFRFFSDILPLEMERTRRAAQPLSLIILDIDHFKMFNDRWGHECGNQALVHVAQLITATVRKLDFACRFGGEEFVIVLPGTDLYQAMNVAERLRCAIATSPLMFQDAVTITASLGVDEFRANHTESMQGFIERVDTWLYQAKHAGRNLVRGPIVAPVDVGTNVTADERDALFGIFSSDGA